MRIAACSCALLLVLAGCGETQRVREDDLAVRATPAGQEPRPQPPERRTAGPQINVVTHGQASSHFWVIVRNGVDAAARQMDASVSYRSPDTYSIPRMRALIDAAVAERPEGLVVSIPAPGVEPAVRRAVDAGIPVVSINTGSTVFRRLGVLAHIGEPEGRAGAEAGRRLARAGVRRGLCVDHEPGNTGLELRCRAFAAAIERVGGTVRVVIVDVQDRVATRQTLANVIRSDRIDGVLALNAEGAEAALDAVRSAHRSLPVQVATFDLSPEVLAAIRTGRVAFAVDQQAYLQGYLPIVLLTQRIRYGLFAAEGEVVATGPTFVTKANANRATLLSERGIR